MKLEGVDNVERGKEEEEEEKRRKKMKKNESAN